MDFNVYFTGQFPVLSVIGRCYMIYFSLARFIIVFKIQKDIHMTPFKLKYI